MTLNRMLSPKGRARKIGNKWLHPGTNWIVDLTFDIEEQIRDAVEEQHEKRIQAVIEWGENRVQSDRHASEAIAMHLRARQP